MTTATVELSQASTELAQLVAQARNGIEILITSGGLPVARLLPATEAPANRIPGSAKGLFTVPDDFDAPLEDFREHM